MRIRINGVKFIVLSEILLILYLCLPITISLLNSILIRLLVLVAALSFIVGMVLENQFRYLIQLLCLFLITLLFWHVVWRNQLDSLSYIYYYFASLSFVYGGIILYKSEDYAMAKRLFIFLTGIYVVTAITSIRGLAIYPLAAREMARGSTYNLSLNFEVYKTIYRKMNIASWGQIYGMLFLIPGMCIMWKKTKKVHWLIFTTILLIAIVTSQITFAAILGVVLFVGTLIIGCNNKKKVFLLLAGSIIVLLIIIDMDDVLNLLIATSERIGFDFLSDKLNDMSQLLLYKQAVGDAGSRLDLYNSSFNSFISSPIVGQILNPNVTQDIIGRHSEFLDIVAATGVIGVLGIIFALSKYFQFIKTIHPDYRRELFITFIGFVVLFVINPVLSSPPIFISVFLYTLLCVKICCQEKQKLKKHLKIILS